MTPVALLLYAVLGLMIWAMGITMLGAVMPRRIARGEELDAEIAGVAAENVRRSDLHLGRAF
jgi:hypothetical protein